jgi:hypothetical protein
VGRAHDGGMQSITTSSSSSNMGGNGVSHQHQAAGVSSSTRSSSSSTARAQQQQGLSSSSSDSGLSSEANAGIEGVDVPSAWHWCWAVVRDAGSAVMCGGLAGTVVSWGG